MTVIDIERMMSSIKTLTEENAQLRADIDYLAAERGIEKKRAESLEEKMATLHTLYEAEADTANDLAQEVARLNKILKSKTEKQT